MRPERMQVALDRITRVRGVRGAMVVSADDGLVGPRLATGLRSRRRPPVASRKPAFYWAS